MLFCLQEKWISYNNLLVQVSPYQNPKTEEGLSVKVDSFTFFEERSDTVRTSTSHSWKDTPTMAQLVVFMFQVLYHYATNPNTPFDVDEMTFLDSRNKTKDELEVMLAHLQKQFIVDFPDGKESHVSFWGLKLFP